MTDVPANTLTPDQSRALAEQSYEEHDPLAVEAERKKDEYNKKVLAREEKRKAAEAAAEKTRVLDMTPGQQTRWKKNEIPLPPAEIIRRQRVLKTDKRRGNFYRNAAKDEEEELARIRARVKKMRVDDMKGKQRKPHAAFVAKTNPTAAAKAPRVAPTAGAPPPKKKRWWEKLFLGKGGRKRGRKRITRKKRGGRKRKNKTKTKRKTLSKSHKKRRKMARRKKTKRRR
jgi:hypothetical protein